MLMRACRLGDPIIVARVVRRVPSVLPALGQTGRCPVASNRPAPAPYKTGSASSAMPATKAATPAKRTLWLREITRDAFHLFHVVPVNPIAQASIESLQTPTPSQSCACSSSIQVRHPTS